MKLFAEPIRPFPVSKNRERRRCQRRADDYQRTQAM